MNRKLTSDQTALLQNLLDSQTACVVVQVNGSQLMRTAYSLQRKGLCHVKFLKKAPGAKYSYGYRGIELTRAYATPPQGTKLPGVVVGPRPGDGFPETDGYRRL